MGRPRPGRKVVYSGDTRPCSGVFVASNKVDLLIHDATFADDMLDWAKKTQHSTAGEAASLASLANAYQLVLTHISSRYSDDTSQLLEDAKKEFGNVSIATEFMEIEIPYRND